MDKIKFLKQVTEHRKEFCSSYDKCEGCPYVKYDEDISCDMLFLWDRLVIGGVLENDNSNNT